jgi:sigma-B regulation protein RsbU (phosphoserine phosphatase)
MTRLKNRKSLKGKVLVAMLSIAGGLILLFSVSALGMSVSVGRYLLAVSSRFGESTADNSRLAMTKQVMETLKAIAVDLAVHVDSHLGTIQNSVRTTADAATLIYTNKQNYRPRSLSRSNAASAAPSFVPDVLFAPGVDPSRVLPEVSLAANISDTLEILRAEGYPLCYLGAESGFLILAESEDDPLPNVVDSFDPRTRNWYIKAKTENALVWSDIFLDINGRGYAISCAAPFYEIVNGESIMRGVVGAGSILSGEIRRIIDESKISMHGCAVVTDAAGSIVAYSTDFSEFFPSNLYGDLRAGTNLSRYPETAALASNIMSGEAGVADFSFRGTNYYAAYAPLSLINWNVCILTPVETIITPASVIQRDILTMTEAAESAIVRRIYVTIVFWIALIALAVGSVYIIAVRLSKKLTANIGALQKGAEVISAGDMSHKLEMKTNDELEDLAASFNVMIDNIKRISGDRERIQTELQLAWQIQRDMLPSLDPKLSLDPSINLYAKTEPAREVGGDFYDFFYLDEDETKLALVIADVSGKGVPAALFMVIAKTLIKQRLLLSSDPASCLDEVNHILCEDNPNAMFATVFILTLDLSSGEAVYAGGGHPAPLIALDGRAFRFMEISPAVPPGMLKQSRYTRGEIRLPLGARIYFYTDGVTEAMNAADEEFGKLRLVSLASDYADSRPAADFDAAIRGAVRLWTDSGAPSGSVEQSDDITTMAFRWTARKFRKCLPALAEKLDDLLDWADTVLSDAPARLRNRIAVIAEELFVNTASYAYQGFECPGSVEATLARTPEHIIMQFSDAGIPFNPLEYTPPPRAEDSPLSVTGRGILLIRSWSDSASYTRAHQKNNLTLFFNLG